MPMSLAVTGLPITVVPGAARKSRIPMDWVLASGSGPQAPGTSHSLPDHGVSGHGCARAVAHLDAVLGEPPSGGRLPSRCSR